MTIQHRPMQVCHPGIAGKDLVMTYRAVGHSMKHPDNALTEIWFNVHAKLHIDILSLGQLDHQHVY